VHVDDAAKLVGEQLGELVPGHRDELVGPAPGGRPGALLEPPAADCGRLDPRPVPNRAREIAEQGRRVGVGGKRLNRRDVAVADVGGERTPVGE
jgi:hypothetical protein